MLKNPCYVYGEGMVNLPHHLNLGQYIVETLWGYGDKTALINGITHEKLTYRDIVKDAMNIALSLTRMGVKRGNTIAICSENRQEYWSAFIGISCTGATFTAISVAYIKEEMKHILNISKPKMIFCSTSAYKTFHGEVLRNLPYMEKMIIFGKDRLPNTVLYDDLVKAEVNYNVNSFVAADVTGQTDIAIILYSSGTTGLPKGVMLTHLNVIVGCIISSILNPAELTLLITPWYHVMGLIGLLGALTYGSSLVYLPKFDKDYYLKTIERYRIAQIVVPPALLVTLCKTQTDYDVSSLKLVLSGSAPLKADTIAVIKNRFPNVTTILQGYGMTESTYTISKDKYDTVQLNKIGSVGRAIPSIIVKIADIETGKPLGVNQPGEICIKGPTVMMGYVEKDRSEDFDDEGFFKTGDIGYYDDDKSFFIIDRLKEIIKYKGHQVSPAEIEGLLLQHPSVRDAGVVGIPHENGEEVPRAYVVLQPEAELSEEEIKIFVAENLSYPKHLRGGAHIVNEIPKNPSGKILRRKLREVANNT